MKASVNFLFPEGSSRQSTKRTMSIRKLGSQPLMRSEFIQLSRKSIKVSPPPKVESREIFDNVYESEIEQKEDSIIGADDSLSNQIKNNESMMEINELLDDISNTTPDRTDVALDKLSIGRLSKI